MPPLLLAEFEFKHLVYLLFFVLWIVGQIFESNKKKKIKQEREAAERTGRPPPQQTAPKSEAPLGGDLQKLLEQLTGQPMPDEQKPRPAPRPRPTQASPAPPPPLPAHATMTQAREHAQKLKNQLRQSQAARAARPQQRPQPQRHETYEVVRAAPSAAPGPVAAASISIAYKDLNVRDRHMHTPPMRVAPSSPMRATADAQRLAWIKNPATLRQLMAARFVLDPPKALEN